MWQKQGQVASEVSNSFPVPFGGGLAADDYYVAKFRNLTFDKDTLFNNTCFVPVSLGQEYHEGRKFESIMQLVEKTFKDCVIIVSDLLHRHTLAINNPGLSRLQAYEQSITVGREWVKNNEPSWRNCNIPCTVVYWSELLTSDEYLLNRCAIDDFCTQESCVSELVEQMVGYFVESACDDGVSENERRRVADLSREYLLEEHAIQLSMIPKQYPNHHFVYPHTNRLDPLMEFYERISGEMCRWLRLRISRKQRV